MKFMFIIVTKFILLISTFKHFYVECNNDTDTNEILQLPEYDENGRMKFIPRIVGGSTAQAGQFHGIVSLQSLRGEHFCGGTLVRAFNRTFVLTAAHCVVDKDKRRSNPRKIQVMADDLSISFYKLPSSRRQVRRVKQIIPHSRFHPLRISNDIAVIYLHHDFEYTATFGPISLPTHDIKFDAECVVAGWGKLVENGTSSTELQAVRLQIIPHLVCNRQNAYKGKITKYTFCAGAREGGKDSCQGDSGGGLLCEKDVTGIVSYGFGCGKQNFPGIYTNVYKYLEWIEKSSSTTSIFNSTIIPMAIASIIYLGQSFFF